VPYVGVIGDQEMSQNKIALKSPKHGDFGARDINEVKTVLQKEINSRSADPGF
jgi:threonyl-tRNA synthetase